MVRHDADYYTAIDADIIKRREDAEELIRLRIENERLKRELAEAQKDLIGSNNACDRAEVEATRLDSIVRTALANETKDQREIQDLKALINSLSVVRLAEDQALPPPRSGCNYVLAQDAIAAGFRRVVPLTGEGKE